METLNLNDLVGSTLYVKIDSVRSIRGTLVAIDAQANLLLDNVFERRVVESNTELNSGESGSPVPLSSSYNVRSLGLVSVPRPSVESIMIESARLDKLVGSKKEFVMRNVV